MVAKPQQCTAAQSGDPQFEAAFERAFGPVAFTVNRHLIEHMMRAQRELGVDYESLVIWGILAHLNVAHLLPPGKALAQITLDIDSALIDPENGFRMLRLRDLEQVTGLPRETVRRKLSRLEKLGYITHNSKGWLVRPESVDERLRNFTRETTQNLLKAAQHVTELLQDP